MSQRTCFPIKVSAGQKHILHRTRDLLILLVALSAVLAVNGCHSAYVKATIRNRGSSAISLVQVEYPSASFGTQTIAPGEDFKYRFKVLGSGTMKITYTDSAQVEHKFTGPSLKESDEGSLMIIADGTKVEWQPHLTSH